MLVASLVMGASYATEWFTAWYGGEHARAQRRRVRSSPAPTRRSIGCCCCFNVRAAADPLVARRRAAASWLLAVCRSASLIGMWLERILIIWNTLGAHATCRACGMCSSDADRLGLPVRAARRSSPSCSCFSPASFRSCRCTRSGNWPTSRSGARHEGAARRVRARRGDRRRRSTRRDAEGFPAPRRA